jgi:uncharacterized membrane protein
MDSHRYVLAGVLFGLALATKQSVVVIFACYILAASTHRARLQFGVAAMVTALAFVLPFFAWHPREFVSCVTRHLQIAPRADSLSVRAALFHLVGWSPPTALGWLAGAAGLWIMRNYRGAAAAMLSSALVSLLFYNFERQAFCNYYYLALLLLAGGVLMVQGAAHNSPQPVESSSRTRA